MRQKTPPKERNKRSGNMSAIVKEKPNNSQVMVSKTAYKPQRTETRAIVFTAVKKSGSTVVREVIPLANLLD